MRHHDPGAPHHGGGGGGAAQAGADGRFDYQTGWRDLPWAVLFFLHLAGMAVTAAAYGPALIRDVYNGGGSGGSTGTTKADEKVSGR